MGEIKVHKIEIFGKHKNMGEMMKNVKSRTSRSYHEFLLERLQDAEETAGYIDVTLEEGGDDPRLLPKVIKNVMESQEKFNSLSDIAKEKWEKLEKILSESKCAEIYALVELLDALGFKLEVRVVSKDDEPVV